MMMNDCDDNNRYANDGDDEDDNDEDDDDLSPGRFSDKNRLNMN